MALSPLHFVHCTLLLHFPYIRSLSLTIFGNLLSTLALHSLQAHLLLFHPRCTRILHSQNTFLFLAYNPTLTLLGRFPLRPANRLWSTLVFRYQGLLGNSLYFRPAILHCQLLHRYWCSFRFYTVFGFGTYLLLQMSNFHLLFLSRYFLYQILLYQNTLPILLVSWLYL